MEDYKDWLNRPCPKCGSNLLTQEDMDSVNQMVIMAELVNNIDMSSIDDDTRGSMKVGMNGTGSVNFGEIVMDEEDG